METARAGNFKFCHNVVLSSLYISTGSDITIYFQSAANCMDMYWSSNDSVNNRLSDFDLTGRKNRSIRFRFRFLIIWSSTRIHYMRQSTNTVHQTPHDQTVESIKTACFKLTALSANWSVLRQSCYNPTRLSRRGERRAWRLMILTFEHANISLYYCGSRQIQISHPLCQCVCVATA